MRKIPTLACGLLCLAPLTVFAQMAPSSGGASDRAADPREKETPPPAAGQEHASPETSGVVPAAPNVAPAPLDDGMAPVKGKWSPVLYGIAEFDAIVDSTQSLNDAAGNSAVARSGTFPGDHGRTTFGVRNSRFGFKLTAPEFGGVRASAVVEGDFFGNQPTGISESAFFTNPTFRARHFALKLESDYVDVLLGQYWQLFGWQTYFHPNTVAIQGVPGQVFGRTPQIRLSHTFKSSAINIDLAAAAMRPVQRNSQVPDGQAGLRFRVNGWKGVHTAGGTGTSVDELGVGVSGVVRRIRVPEFSASPKTTRSKTGWGLSVDALIPVIPVTPKEKGNGLTLTGSFVSGTAISDLFTGLTGGVSFPALSSGTYTSDVDAGLVTFDSQGAIHTIDWEAEIVGIQYYLPPAGNFWISGNYSHMKSKNAADYVDASGRAKIFTESHWADGNLFWNVTPAVRLGAEYSYFRQRYADGVDAENHRGQFSGYYLF